MSAVWVTLLFVFAPVLLIVLCQRVAWLDKLGVVVLSFASGIVLAALVDVPQLTPGVDVKAVQIQITELTIALALPLLVFSMNVRQALLHAGPTLRSMAVALVSVVIISAGLAWLFRHELDPIWQIAAMAVGAYTGGGPNMAAIKTAIEGDQAVFVTMTTYDILLSALYLLFVMTLAKPIFGRFLSPYSHEPLGPDVSDSDFSHLADESAGAFRRLLQRGGRLESIKAALFSLLAVGLSVGLAGLFPSGMQSVLTIIFITSFGLLFSLIPAIHRLKNSFQLGMYLILVFCFTMGAMTDLDVLTQLDMHLFAFIGLMLIGALLLHAVICRLLRIDTDTFLIASAAAIMSVPFIPVIAGALKNRALIVPGFAAAILGYAAGNYLGIGMAFFLRWMLAF